MAHPVLVGAGQVLGSRNLDEAREPAALMAEAAALASEDAGVPGLARTADLVGVVNCVSWHYPDPPGRLGELAGADPTTTLYTAGGGNSAQLLVNAAAHRLARGEARVALLAGAEIVFWRRRARRAGMWFDWPQGTPAVTLGEERFGSHPMELAHGLAAPIAYYPLFESAIAAAAGDTVAARRRFLGELFSRFNAVAAENRYSWFPTRYTGAELATPGPDNRMVGFPYPKRLNAVIDVNQGAALLLTTDETARELGVAPERVAYVHGSADGHEVWYPVTRPVLHEAPGVRVLMTAALAQAGATVDELAAFDIYSCFPSAVQYGLGALGVAPDDPRPITLTGGLPYFGGPANNYSMHAIADMLHFLRERPGARGLVWANGWWATKHSVGVYGSVPPATEFRLRDPSGDQAAIDAGGALAVDDNPTGRATAVAYTVVHPDAEAPPLGVVIGETRAGARFVANLDATQVAAAEEESIVGRVGTVTGADGAFRFAVA